MAIEELKEWEIVIRFKTYEPEAHAVLATINEALEDVGYVRANVEMWKVSHVAVSEA